MAKLHDLISGLLPFLYSIYLRALLIYSTRAALTLDRGLLAEGTDTVRTPDPGLAPETGPTETPETVEQGSLLHLFTLIVDKDSSEKEKEVRNQWVDQ
jgi:hypothetical protein